jgi:valyl-tRNA synthetase
MTELPSVYTPETPESKWYEVWEKRGLFGASPDPAKRPFTIVIPPPNVTGSLHMGHALNNTLQDVLVRRRA